MAVPTQLSDLSATAASNSPAGTDTVGTTMDDFIRAHASIIARISAGTDALATPALGAATATTVNKITFTQPATGATVTIGNGKTLTVNGNTTLNTGISDTATAVALSLSGSGANSVTIANSATNPTIGTSAGDLMLAPEANTALVLANIASAANYLYVQPGVLANENVVLRPAGAATNCALVLSSKGSGGIALDTGTATLIQVLVQHTASADRYITLTGSNGGNPTIGTSGGNLNLAPSTGSVFLNSAATNYIQAYGNTTGSAPGFSAIGGDTNIALALATKGTSPIQFVTDSTVEQVRINHTASADRYITLTGSNGGNPTIGTSAGSLAIGTTMLCAAGVQAKSATATPAGGAVGFYMGSDSVGIYWGSGAPTVSAARGSLYIRTDNGANTSLYVNRDGITNWVAVTSA